MIEIWRGREGVILLRNKSGSIELSPDEQLEVSGYLAFSPKRGRALTGADRKRRDARFIELWNAGAEPVIIRHELGLTKSGVHDVRKRLGLPSRASPAMIEQGKKIAAVAQQAKKAKLSLIK